MAKFSLKEAEDETGGNKRRKVRGEVEEIDANSSKGGKKLLKSNGVDKEEQERVEDDDEEEDFDDEREEEEEEESELEVHASPRKENSDGISTKIDPDVLDCSICFEPLRPPCLY